MEVSARKVGERIRAIRGNRTQKQFANELGVASQVYISRYETNRIPNPSLLVRIAKFGKTSVDYLLTGKNPKPAA